MARIDLRLTEEEKQKARQQAEQLGLDISGYIKLIINLDASTAIMENLNNNEIIDFLVAENMAIMALMKVKGIADDDEFALAYKAARERMTEKLKEV